MKIQADTPEEYIDLLPADRKEAIRKFQTVSYCKSPQVARQGSHSTGGGPPLKT